MSAVEVIGPDQDGPPGVDPDCPDEVVDRLLWRTAQRILQRHVERLDGTCHWCGRPAPCAARDLAVRADEVSRMPRREAAVIRNEITRLLPVFTAQLLGPPRTEREQPAAPRRWQRRNVRRAI